MWSNDMHIYLFWVPKNKGSLKIVLHSFFLNNQDGFGEGFMMEY